MSHDDELKSLWQSNEPPKEESMSTTIVLDDVKRDASRFERTIRFRNLREYVAGAIVAALFGARAVFASSWLERLGSLELVVSAAWIAWTLARHGRSEGALPPTATTREVLGFRRTQMERQIALLSRVPRFYLAPLALGLGLIWISDAMKLGMSLFLVVYGVGVVALFVFIAWLNQRAARKLRRELEALPRGVTS